MNDYNLVIKEDVSKEILKLLKKYWKFVNGVFVNKRSDLAEKLGMTIEEVTKAVRDNSTMVIVLKCNQCDDYFNENAFSQTRFLKLMNTSNYCCAGCEFKIELERLKRIEEEKETERIRLDSIQKSLNNYDRKVLARLRGRERYFLRKICQFEGNGRTIYGFIMRNEYQITWSELSALENMDVIYVVRNGNFLIRVLYPETLLADIKLADDSEMKRTTPNSKEEPNILNFKVSENALRKENQVIPLYQSIQTFERDFLVKANVKYSCAIWERSDGLVNISLKPVDTIINSRETPLWQEPRHIRDVINEYWNKKKDGY